MKRIKTLAIPILVLTVLAGCKKSFLETTYSNAVLQENIFESTAKVELALNGMYETMFAFAPNGSGRHDNYGQKSWDLSSELMGQDMVVHTQGYGWYNRAYQYTEWLQDNAGRQPSNAWDYYYNIIGQTNSILAGIDNAKGDAAVKEAFKGEALGMRAYAYFYLANYWQQTYKGNETKPGIPIALNGDVDNHPRGTLQEVYDRIITDLTDAENLLNGKTRTVKTHIDVSVVRGFRARVALLMEDWATAATYANKAKQGYSLMTQAQYLATDAFSNINNIEWMWGSLIPAEKATIYASFFSHMDVRTGGYAALGGQKKITKALYDQIPAGDVRKDRFQTPGTGTSTSPDYNQLKFQVPTAGNWGADYLYMSVAEMYLIEAEALSRQNQDGSARTVLENLVKSRYPAYTAATLSGTALLNEILLQRRIELWGEGLALMDVKRLKMGLNRLSGPGNHGSPNYDPAVYTLPDGDRTFLMRIPRGEIDTNPLISEADQNP